jgi:hypothetical protein
VGWLVIPLNVRGITSPFFVSFHFLFLPLFFCFFPLSISFLIKEEKGDGDEEKIKFPLLQFLSKLP